MQLHERKTITDSPKSDYNSNRGKSNGGLQILVPDTPMTGRRTAGDSSSESVFLNEGYGASGGVSYCANFFIDLDQ